MRKTVLLVASLLLLGPGFAMANDHGSGAPTWRSKADGPLLEAYDAGQEILEIGLVGPRVAIPDGGFATRAEARAFYEEQTAPFFAMVRELAGRAGATLEQESPYANTAFLSVARDALPDLVGRGEVRRAGLDWLGATFLLDEGPGVAANLDATIAKVEAPELHALGLRGEGVRVAIIDTGVRSTHEMMKNADGTTRVTFWSDHTTTPGGPGYCANPCDANGHGTHTATTAWGSNLFNTSSPQGVAPRADIMGVRIFQGGGGQWEWAQAGLQSAFDNGAEITSNSWGGGCSGLGVTTAELAEDLQELGMMNVFAAGNSGFGGVLCPGMVDNVITVGAIDINEVIAGFSSRGPCVWPVGSGNSRVCPDVSAVGVDVNAGWNTCDTCYNSISGTSMATPHVAGVVTLLQQAWKADHAGVGFDAGAKQAEIILRYSAKDLGASGPDNDYGWGLAKGKAAYDLMSSDVPLNLRHLFAVGKPVLRAYETNGISLSVANLGTIGVTGTLTLDIRQVDTGVCPPTCDTTLLSKSANLGPISEGAIAYTFDGATHPAGNYLVNAKYAYTYSGGSGSIEETASFLLKKVQFVKTRVVTASETTGEVLFAGLALANIGNENATSVKYYEKYRADGFAPLPAVPPGTGQFGVFANPAPDNVRNSRVNPPEIRYEWTSIGNVNYGSAFEADFNFLVGAPGTYTTTGTLTYNDEVGRAFNESFNLVTTVTPPV